MADGRDTIAGGVPVPRRNPRYPATEAQKEAGREKLRRAFERRALNRLMKKLGREAERDKADAEGDIIRRKTHRDPRTGEIVGPETKRYPHGKGI